MGTLVGVLPPSSRSESARFDLKSLEDGGGGGIRNSFPLYLFRLPGVTVPDLNDPGESIDADDRGGAADLERRFLGD